MNNYTRKETTYESVQKSPLIIAIVTVVKNGNYESLYFLFGL